MKNNLAQLPLEADEKFDEKVAELRNANILKETHESKTVDFGYRVLVDTKDGHEVFKIVDFGNIKRFYRQTILTILSEAERATEVAERLDTQGDRNTKDEQWNSALSQVKSLWREWRGDNQNSI